MTAKSNTGRSSGMKYSFTFINLTQFKLSIFIAFILAIMLIKPATAEISYQLDVTYTNGSIISGPLSFGLRTLPDSVSATFILGPGQELKPEPGEIGDIYFDEADALFGTRMTFGDASWSNTELENFSLIYSVSTGGSGGEDRLTELSYRFYPITTQLVEGGITLNFPLSITGTDKATGMPFEYSYTESTQTLTPISDTLTVNIDIKPGSDPNCFNINGHGVIPVAILGNTDFDVSQIDANSLSFGGLTVRVRGNKGALCSIDYSNDDTYLDLVCHFEDDAANWQAGDSEATLTGNLIDGASFEATDTLCIAP